MATGINLKVIVAAVIAAGLGAGTSFVALTNGLFESSARDDGATADHSKSAPTDRRNTGMQPPTSSDGDEDQAASASQDELATRVIDELLAHPDDPQNPHDVVGVSDEEVKNLPQEELQKIFDVAEPYARQHPESPRFLFALGRAALLAGQEDSARDLLQQASQNGSAAATAYLAALTDDTGAMESLLRRAVEGGFKPAEEWLEQLEQSARLTEAKAREEELARIAAAKADQQRKAVSFNASSFNMPDVISAFYSGDVERLGDDFLGNLTYASAIQEFLLDTSLVLFVVEDRTIITETDASLSQDIARKLMTTNHGVNEATSAGVSSMFAPLMAMAQTRQGGGSIMQEVQAMNTAIMNTPTVRLDLIRQKATQDAKRLALIYDQDPETFRRIYKGMCKFVRTL